MIGIVSQSDDDGGLIRPDDGSSLVSFDQSIGIPLPLPVGLVLRFRAVATDTGRMAEGGFIAGMQVEG
jgi:hypothetical protein